MRQPIRSTADRIQRLLMDFGLPASTPTDYHFTRDLGLDSLDMTDLLIRVEADFGIRIDDRDWHGLRTIETLTAYIDMEEGQATTTIAAGWLPQPASLASYPLFN